MITAGLRQTNGQKLQEGIPKESESPANLEVSPSKLSALPGPDPLNKNCLSLLELA